MRALPILAVLATTAHVAASPGVRVYQAKDPAITEGETTLDGDPAAVYELMLDYKRWTEVFPDIAKVVVTSQKGVEARVTLIGTDGHRDNLVFRNQPKARMVYFEDTSQRAEVWEEIVFVPGDSEGTTRVHTRLFASVRGVASLVVGEGSVRKLRESRIERQLVQMRDYFRRR